VADAFARANRVEQAATVATQVLLASEMINDYTKVLHVQASMAQWLSQAGQREMAVSVANQIRLAAERIQDEERRAWAMVAVTQALAYTGEFAQALQVAQEIGTAPIDERLNEALSHAEVEPANSVQLTEAFDALLGNWYDLGGYRALAFTSIAQAHIQAKMTEQGIDIAQHAWEEVNGAEDQDRKMEVLSLVAHTLALAGEIDLAMKAADSISSRKLRISAYCNVASGFATIGKSSHSLMAANRALVLVEEAPIWASLDDTPHITIVGGNYGQQMKSVGEWLKDEVVALSEVAQAFAFALKPAQALEVVNRAQRRAESIAIQRNRAIALGSVASALSQAGAPEQATETIQEAWAYAQGVEEQEGKAAAAIAFSSVMSALYTLGKSEQALEAFESALIAAAQVNRESLLDVLQEGVPLLAQRDQGQVLVTVYEILMEIENWWGV
jgi:tetratricopeptide (TPR) repeat protein